VPSAAVIGPLRGSRVVCGAGRAPRRPARPAAVDIGSAGAGALSSININTRSAWRPASPRSY